MNTNARTLKLLEAIADQLAPPLGRESLPRSSDSKQRILQTTEEVARRLGILSALPSEEEMATVTYSIGTSGRDYSTVVSWESDLDNVALYSSGDDAVGEMYNDSAFDEIVYINGGGTVGLASRTLQAASGERHDGTAGSGARFVYTSNSNPMMRASGSDVALKWIEFNWNGENIRDGIRDAGLVQNCICHNSASSRTNPTHAITKASGDCSFTGNIVYDMANTNSGGVFAIDVNQGSANVNVMNNTVHDITTTSSGNCYGIQSVDQASEDIRNNICTSCDTAGFEISSPASATMDYNATDDTSAAGANSLNSITVANQYVSTVGGSEDLHLKTGADAIDEGVDLGTTPAGVEVDINGRDRDANADTWDIGAHEFVGGGGPTPSSGFPYQIYYG